MLIPGFLFDFLGIDIVLLVNIIVYDSKYRKLRINLKLNNKYFSTSTQPHFDEAKLGGCIFLT